MVVPSHDLVVILTSAQQEVQQAQDVLDAIWECLLPGIDHPGSTRDDEVLTDRLRRLSLVPVPCSDSPGRSVTATLDASAEGSALPDGTTVIVGPTDRGWLIQIGSVLEIEVGRGEWRESSPLGRPVCASGAWLDTMFVADLYIITTPHRVRLAVDANAGTAVATWSTVPLTSPDLVLHLRSPLMTRPDVA